jgi:multiple sugar transport system ATP-binding protein
MTMGDRVAVMRDGRLVQLDTPQALYARPADLFVAGFIGSPAMNFVQARLRACSRGETLALAVDPATLIFFAPDTETALR